MAAAMAVTTAMCADQPGITVTGSGSASIMPNEAIMTMKIASKAELAGDAVVKFQDAKRRALKALKAAGIEGVTVKETGISLNRGSTNQQQQMMMAMGGGNAAPAKKEVGLAEKLEIRIAGLDKLDEAARIDRITKTIDAAKDAGLEFDAGNMNIYQVQFANADANAAVVFVAQDTDAVYRDARKAAVADAKRKAEELAELSGVSLGAVQGIWEGQTAAAGTDSNPAMAMWMGMMAEQQEKDDKRLSTAVFGIRSSKLFVMLLVCASTTVSAANPEYITPETRIAVDRGLKYLASTQASDGGWTAERAGSAYPVTMTALAGMAFLANGNTPSRGPYAKQVQKALQYLMARSTSSGLITGSSQESGRPMYGHGFALMFFSVAYGMETNDRNRKKLREVIKKGIRLTAAAQNPAGGWTYIPGGGDEGSVTVTQIQALRAAHNAGFKVPDGTIEEAVRYVGRCAVPGGGIRYSLNSGGTPQLAISAAATATLYNAGEYDSPVADTCLRWVQERFRARNDSWSKGSGHDFYTHLYAAQAFYMTDDEYWGEYFPSARDQLIKTQQENGSWSGDGIGNVFGTSVALTILQLPYKFLPVYQR
jgi:uncharacterized protein YggE